MSDYIEFTLQYDEQTSKRNLGKFKTKISALCSYESGCDWFEIYKNVEEDTITTGCLKI